MLHYGSRNAYLTGDDILIWTTLHKKAMPFLSHLPFTQLCVVEVYP